jgi:hypothetical protein
MHSSMDVIRVNALSKLGESEPCYARRAICLTVSSDPIPFTGKAPGRTVFSILLPVRSFEP